jgi:acyl-coenzyme A thioesterase PaaI-like protein
MPVKAIQDYYPEKIAICYGCGRRNSEGLHIRSYWEDGEGVCRFYPKPYHTGFTDVVYGGLIADLIDCHSIATAIAAAYQAEERGMDTQPSIVFVTANLNVSYLKPTPINVELVLRARVKTLYQRKATVICSLYSGGKETAHGEVVAVRVPQEEHSVPAENGYS